MLYYSLPMLNDLLPTDYTHHVSLLVSAMHLLNDISLADIHNLLDLFYKLTCQLYPINICTMNLHLQIHLAKFVRSWGPLWCYSCFGMNGHLRKNCHGTRLVLTQLIHVRMRQLLPKVCKQLDWQHHQYPPSLNLSRRQKLKMLSAVSKVKGRITHKQVNDSIANALFSADFIDTLHPLPALPTC